VVRNRIKRWLRAAIQQSKIDDNKIKRPVDIIVIVRPGKEIKNFQIVKETINNLFNKVKLWNF
jgi:ribonuclease P protein component